MVALVNLCGCGSSGTTLLSQMLNRHPDLLCGEEIGFFSKPIIYQSFHRLKRYFQLVHKFGVSGAPYFYDRSILRNMSSYHLANNIGYYLGSSSDLQSFVEKIAGEILSVNHKEIFVEKTPENIYLVRSFLNAFPKAKIIHLVRDPRDVVLSLVGRGLSQREAALTWLGSVASIQAVKADSRLFEMRYEDLVHQPEEELSRLAAFLGVEYKYEYFFSNQYRSAGIDRNNGFDCWQSKPGEDISKRSVGKFRSSMEAFTWLYGCRLTDNFAQLLDVESYDFAELMGDYGYPVSKTKFAATGEIYRAEPASAGFWRKLTTTFMDALLQQPKVEASMVC